MKIKKKPLSLYIHIPFCKKKCLYCDFLSAPACGQERESYVKALLREINLMARAVKDYEILSVFFGGGTPSLLNKSQMERIMFAINREYNLNPDAEITIECNPATADLDKLSFYRECGINRLSIGLQSANDEELKGLGRIHSYGQFLDTFESARKAGFTNINIDIMSALPGQTYESYVDTLEKVIALNPEHISAYSLIIEEGTPFYERYGNAVDETYPELPAEEVERKMYHATQKILKKAGYLRYEISNYAKKGYECRHNLTYWTGIDYLGMGIGAASYLQGFRFKNCTDRGEYTGFFLRENTISLSKTKLEGGHEDAIFHPLHEEIQNLSLEERMEEFMFLGLRLKRGISIAEFVRQFGKTPDEVYPGIIERLHNEKLLLCKNGRIFLSKKGTDVANYVMAEFIL